MQINPIKNGIVIDHIASGNSMEIYDLFYIKIGQHEGILFPKSFFSAVCGRGNPVCPGKRIDEEKIIVKAAVAGSILYGFSQA